MPTLREVAEEAGVSLATASRALSGSRGVTVENEQAVKHAAARLGYRTNGIARALRSHRTQMVGVLIPHIADPFFPRVVQELERSLQRDQRSILLVDSLGDPTLERERINDLLDRQVDALVVVPAHPQESCTTIELAAATVPLVQLDRPVAAPTDVASIDHRGGIYLAVDHLVAGGCRRLSFVGAESPLEAVTSRRDAFIERLQHHGLPLPTTTPLGSFSVAWGAEAAGALLHTDPSVDGIVCANDLIAIGVLRALRARGRIVPDEIAVTGFDDVGFAEVSDPPLTTIRQPVSELGRAAAELLTARIDADEHRPPRHITLPAELVQRGSTTPVGATTTRVTATADTPGTMGEQSQ